MFWTQEMDDQLRKLAIDGWSMSQIAAQLGNGLSRNACIGRWHRLKTKDGTLRLPSKPHSRILETVSDGVARISPQLLRNTTPKRRCEPQRPMPKVAKVGLGFLLPALPEPPRGPAVGILDVTGCKWAVGEDASVPGRHTFCNSETDSSPYCAYHRAIYVQKPTPKEQVKRYRTPGALVRAGLA